MTFWRTGALTAALIGVGSMGAPFEPAARGQEARAVVAPQASVTQAWRLGGNAEIGVTVREVGEDDSKGGGRGALIASVTDDGPAAKAGMKTGDIVVEFDGERIRSARQFVRVVEETPIGRRVDAVVLRGGQRTTVAVQPRDARSGSFRLLSDMTPRFRELERNLRLELPAIPTPPAVPDFEPFMGPWTNRFGITVDDLSSQLAQYFGTKDGVLVASVTDGSAAAKAGVKAGDVITTFDNEPITRASELRRRIQRLDEGAEFTIGIMRDKKPMTLKGKVEPRAERVRTYRS